MLEKIRMPECFIEPVDKAMREVELLKKKYKEDDMFSIWTGPDVTWSTTKEGYEKMLEYCLSENVRYSMHIKETEVIIKCARNITIRTLLIYLRKSDS